ncbi:CDP-paratose 2-epimerase, partial [Photorhabdus sp. P32]
LIELFNLLQEISGTTLNYEKLAPRESDQKIFVADVSKISHYVEWMPKVTSKEGVKKMFDWCASL